MSTTIKQTEVPVGGFYRGPGDKVIMRTGIDSTVNPGNAKDVEYELDDDGHYEGKGPIEVAKDADVFLLGHQLKVFEDGAAN